MKSVYIGYDLTADLTVACTIDCVCAHLFSTFYDTSNDTATVATANEQKMPYLVIICIHIIEFAFMACHRCV